MAKDLQDLQRIAEKVTKMLQKHNASYIVVLHDQKTGRVLSYGGVTGKNVEDKRRAYERLIYSMLLSIIGLVIRDIQSGQKDLISLAFNKFIEDSKKEDVKYIG